MFSAARCFAIRKNAGERRTVKSANHGNNRSPRPERFVRKAANQHPRLERRGIKLSARIKTARQKSITLSAGRRCYFFSRYCYSPAANVSSVVPIEEASALYIESSPAGTFMLPVLNFSQSVRVLVKWILYLHLSTADLRFLQP